MIEPVADKKQEYESDEPTDEVLCCLCGRRVTEEESVVGHDNLFCSFLCRDIIEVEWSLTKDVYEFANTYAEEFFDFIEEKTKREVEETFSKHNVEIVAEKWVREFCAHAGGFFQWLEEKDYTDKKKENRQQKTGEEIEQ